MIMAFSNFSWNYVSRGFLSYKQLFFHPASLIAYVSSSNKLPVQVNCISCHLRPTEQKKSMQNNQKATTTKGSLNTGKYFKAV